MHDFPYCFLLLVCSLLFLCEGHLLVSCCLSVVVSVYGCECLCNILGTCQSYSTSDPGQVIGYFTVYLCSYQHRVRGATAQYKFIFYGSQHLHTKKSLTVSVKTTGRVGGGGRDREREKQTDRQRATVDLGTQGFTGSEFTRE